ncbi:MAG: sortase [Lachnospiraceae bacterium]|nr:sortase [Lachnospiraceae bacterium]
MIVRTKKDKRIYRTALFICLTALILTGCEGSLRDRREGLSEQEPAQASEEEALRKEDSGGQAPAEEALTEPEIPEAMEVPAASENPEASTPPEEEEVRSPLPEYDALLQVNPYVSGWLRIDDTVIDYPVVYTPLSQNYFLHRAIDGSDAYAGSLFIAVAWHEGTDQTMIYGHNMKDGSAFGSLQKYADEAYGRSHSVIRFDTLYEESEYALYGAFYSQIDEEDLETEEDRAEADRNIEEGALAGQEGALSPEELTLFDIDLSRDFGDEDIYRQEKDEDNGRFRYYYYTDLSDEEDFYYFAQSVKERSLYDTGIEAEWGDQFITLSTCSYQVRNGRFVVVGIKRK